MKINAISNYKANYAYLNKKTAQKTPKTASQTLPSNSFAFGGLFSNIIYPFQYNLETKLDYDEIFEDIEKSSKHLRVLAQYLIRDGRLFDSIHNFDSMTQFAQNINPNCIEEINENLVSINNLTTKPESYIKYSSDLKYFPEIRRKIRIKTPEQIIIGKSKEFGGATEEVYDIKNKVVMKNVKSNFADPMKAQRVEVLDVSECTIPAFKFLGEMDCDNAILNDVKMGSDGHIEAKSIITYKEYPDGTVKVKDMYLNPRISQSRVRSSENPNAYPDWRIIIDADDKISSIDNAKYRSISDYGSKSIIAKNVKEIFKPKEGRWYGKNDYTIIPNRKVKKGEIDYTCKFACRTIDGKPTQWLKSRVIAAA